MRSYHIQEYMGKGVGRVDNQIIQMISNNMVIARDVIISDNNEWHSKEILEKCLIINK